MGMDCYIWEAPNHRVFKDENWYSSGVVKQRMYWRKNWDMVNNWSFLPKITKMEISLKLGVRNLRK